MPVSQLMYKFEELRIIVSKHEKTFNEELSDRKKKEIGIVEFNTPALVDTHHLAVNKFPAAKLRNPVTAATISS